MLLIEDVEPIRNLVARVLAARGVRVLEAPDLATARLFLAQPGIDLVLTDGRLPDGESVMLIKEIRERHRARHVVVMSGLALGSPGPAVDAVVPKPFRPDVLVETVLGLLAKSDAAGRRDPLGPCNCCKSPTMPAVASRAKAPVYDVVVVGSGAAGGMAAYVLAQAGLKVVMLEAGRDYRPVDETPMMNLNLQAPLRGAGTPDKPFGFYDATVNGGWKVPGEPYTNGPGDRLPLVALAHAGRAHQPLGPDLAAHGALRLQAAQPGRAGLRLADQPTRTWRPITTRSRR